MAEVKWIKIVVDIFDDEKILLIESLPSADSIIVIWFKLLCLAGKNNNSGVFVMNDKIPYTEEMLATIFRRNVNTVRLALKTFEAYGMIEIMDGIITIPNWGKHQNFEKIEQKNAYMKEYMREYREKQKKKIECKINSKANSKSNGKANVSEADIELDIEKEIDEDKEREKEINKDNTPPISPSKRNKGDEKKETPRQTLDRILPEFDISEYLINAVIEWIDYKKENFNFSYLESSLKSLLKKVINTSKEYGEETVYNIISESIANGYQGITWDKLKNKGRVGGYHNRTAEMLQESYSMISNWVKRKEEEENANDIK